MLPRPSHLPKLCRLTMGVTVAIFLLTICQVAFSASPNNRGSRPNIVLINLDDADREMFAPEVLERRFPSINQLARQGLTFTNFHVTTPLCGPSRACLLRGQYAHAIGHRVHLDGTPNTRGYQGDFRAYFRNGYYDDDMGTWMKQAGYHTIFVGKYINYVPIKNRLPEGWDDFYRSQGSRYYETSRFTNRCNPKGQSERLEPGRYRTTAEADDVVRLLQCRGTSGKPLFVYFAPFGPHTEGKAPGGMIEACDRDAWQDIRQPIDVDFDEKDMSDKPIEYQQIRPITDSFRERLKHDYRDRMLAMRSVDRAVGRIIKTLEETGLRENTFVFLTSDNGYSLGQHRMSGKANTLSRSSQVPLIVAGPGIDAGTSANHLLAHIDLAPTFLELGGANPKTFHDGKSFVPLLRNLQEQPDREWRDAILIENWQSRRFLRYNLNTTFCQLRGYDFSYTEWASGSREFYDLSRDPLELENRISKLSSGRLKQLSDRLKRLRRPQAEPIATVETTVDLIDSGTRSRPIFRGMAEDSSGIQRVEVIVQDMDAKQYWNGSYWQASPVSLNPRLGNPGGIQTEWTLDPGPRFDFDLTKVLVYVRAYSTPGQVTRISWGHRTHLPAPTSRPSSVFRNAGFQKPVQD